MSPRNGLLLLSAALLAPGCQANDVLTPSASSPTLAAAPWGPEQPPFNLEVILRGGDPKDGFGLVKFRQPNDDLLIVRLDTWVRGLQPVTSYLLQRAVDTNLDGVCSSTSWLTLGKGAAAQAILTDERGSGSEALFRSVAAFPVGSSFDIHFQVIEETTGAVALQSDCYRFTISQ